MAKAKKSQQNNFLDELEESISQSKNIPDIKSYSDSPKESELVCKEDSEEETNIDPELAKYEKQINEIYTVLESINPLAILDTEERLKATKLKMEILTKMEIPLGILDRLRSKDKLKTEQIKGNKDISPLEDGSLD